MTRLYQTYCSYCGRYWMSEFEIGPVCENCGFMANYLDPVDDYQSDIPSIRRICAMVIIALLGILLVAALSGCANRGQYYREYYPDGTLKRHAEFYDWKFFYWFGTESAGSETSYWKLYASKLQERPDPNAIEAAGTAAGNILGQAAKTAGGF